jgi:hypothetical protein
MAISDSGDDLIAAIYDAIIDPCGWDEVVKRIVEATKSMRGGLLIQQTDAAHLSAMCNTDPKPRISSDAKRACGMQAGGLRRRIRLSPLACMRLLPYSSQTRVPLKSS